MQRHRSTSLLSKPKKPHCCISDGDTQEQPPYGAPWVYRPTIQAINMRPAVSPTQHTRCSLRMQRHTSIDLLLKLEIPLPGLVHLRLIARDATFVCNATGLSTCYSSWRCLVLYISGNNIRDTATVCSATGLSTYYQSWRCIACCISDST